MSVQLYNNDCLEYIKNIQDASIDMILCDPPYGNLVDKTRASWDSDIDYDILCSEFKRIITDHGVGAVFGNEPFSSVTAIIDQWLDMKILWYFLRQMHLQAVKVIQ